MIEPYRMVIINIICFFLVGVSLLFYRYIYPKKKLHLLIVLIVISFFGIMSVLRNGVYESGDFNLHIYRTMAFYDAIKDGQLMPSWAGELNGTYGYPLFIFLNPLPYYAMSLLHFLGLSFIWSMKIYLIITYVSSGLFMYLFTKLIFKNNYAAFTAAIFYLFAPYHLVDQHFRVAIGEITFFAVLPLFMITLEKVFLSPRLFSAVLCGVLFFFLFASHQAILLLSLPLIAAYILFRLRGIKNRLKTILSLLFSFLIGMTTSSYIWFSQVYLTQYTHAHLISGSSVSFQEIQELLYSPWRYGFLFQGPTGQLSFVIGYTQIIAVSIAFFLLLRKKVNKKIREFLFFWLCLILFYLFMILPYSKIIWDTVPLINTARLSYRLLLLVCFTISVLSGLVALHYYKKRLFLVTAIGLTILYTSLNWGNRGVISTITDETLRSGLPVSTAAGEGLAYLGTPRWVNPQHIWMRNAPKKHAEVVDGEGEIVEINRSTNKHQYLINANTQMTIRENTTFFPGWKIFDNKKEVKIDYENKMDQGVMRFSVSKGLHFITVRYTDIQELRIVKQVSSLSLTLCILFLLYVALFRRNYTKR